MLFNLYVCLLCVCLMHVTHHVGAEVREELGEAGSFFHRDVDPGSELGSADVEANLCP